MAPSIPSWVALSAQQVTDCGVLATASGDPYESGVVEAVRWILGTGPSPMTGTAGSPSAAEAEQEFFVAGQVELGESPLSATTPAATAQGTLRTLSWLLGWEPNPPIALPRRPAPTPEQLFDEAVTAEPWRYRLPEEQAAARLAARLEAARLARLAARADELGAQ